MVIAEIVKCRKKYFKASGEFPEVLYLSENKFLLLILEMYSVSSASRRLIDMKKIVDTVLRDGAVEAAKLFTYMGMRLRVVENPDEVFCLEVTTANADVEEIFKEADGLFSEVGNLTQRVKKITRHLFDKAAKLSSEKKEKKGE